MASTSELPDSRMPPGFSEDDFVFSKLYKCVNVTGQNVMCNIVRNMYSHKSLESNGGHMPLRIYCKTKLEWKDKQFKKFSKLHQPFLDIDLHKADFDITFGYIVVEDVCADLYDKLNGRCSDSLLSLKNMRNKVCHNYGIKTSELTPLVENLTSILEYIYQGVGKVVGVDFTQDITNMKKSLVNIHESKVRQDDFESYLADVRSFRESKKFLMINGGKREVQESYDQLQILNPCTWMTDEEISKTSLSKYQIDKVFTPLKIEDSRQEIDMKDLLQVTKRIGGVETIPCALLMHGLAGCGKTSLCHYLLHEWGKGDHSTNIDAVSNFDLVIFVEVRRARSKRFIEFLMEECLKKTCQDFDPGDVIPTLQDLDVLFVVDGFDEAKKGTTLELVQDIFSKFDNQRILLTTRPEYHTDAEHISRKFKSTFLSIQICGFDENRLKMFSEKVFNALEPNEKVCQAQLKKFLDYIDGPGTVLDEHLRLPLTLALLIYLWRDDPNIVLSVSSATQLYSEIFKLCQKRLKERIDFKGRDNLEDFLQRLLHCLGKQAWCLLLEGNMICLTKKELDKLKKECENNSDLTNQFLSAYLCCETEENKDLKERIFAFLHKTQMEYLAGAYLAYAINEKKVSFESIDAEVNKSSEWRKVLEVVKFLTGTFANTKTLKKDKITKIFRMLECADMSNSNFNFWWSLFIETLKDRDVGMRIVNESLPLEDWKLDQVQVVAGLKFYHCIPVSLKTLVIEIPVDVDAYNIKELLPLMNDIRKKKWIQKKRKKGPIEAVKMELHLWNHEHYHDSRPSDDFILTLNPWSHLTNFTGCLEGEVLSYSSKLKTIRVRLNTVEAVRSFSVSLSRIYKSVGTLRITLGIPFTCSPSDLCEMQFTDKFELTLMETKDDHVQWIEDVVKKINGRNGCRRLTLLNTEITYNTIHRLLKNLKNFVHEKISLDTINEPNPEQMEKLDNLQKNVHTQLNWLDP